MIRKIDYIIGDKGNSITPATKQFGGMQYEDNATLITFDVGKIVEEGMLWRIDFDSPEAGYDPGENATVGEKIERLLPYKMTRLGGEVQVTLVGTRVDDEMQPIKVVYSIPVVIYLKRVAKHEETEDVTVLSVSASEESAKKASADAQQAAKEASESAAAAQTAQQKTEEVQRSLEEGSEFIFLGGDAEGSAEVGLVIDKELSQTSENVVQNRAIAKAVSEIRSDINAEFSNKVSTISDDVTEAQYPTAKAVKDYVDKANNSTEQILEEYIGRVDDYIVEQGTEGRWTYRKWASGVAECWGNTPEELHLITIVYGNAFIENHIRVEFPQNLFVSTPTVTAHFSSQRQSYGCPHATMREIHSVAMEVSVTDNVSSERWGFFCISAIGRWK